MIKFGRQIRGQLCVAYCAPQEAPKPLKNRHKKLMDEDDLSSLELR